MKIKHSYRRLPLIALCAVLAAGCSRSSRTERFVPPADNARKALDSALKSWETGQPPGSVLGASTPKVVAVDSRWLAGEKLQGYEVVKEEKSSGQRVFTVRLRVDKGGPQEVRYYVVGVDPLWVYRDEDFQKLSGAGM